MMKSSFPFDLIASQSNPEHFANDKSGLRLNQFMNGSLILLLMIGVGFGLPWGIATVINLLTGNHSVIGIEI